MCAAGVSPRRSCRWINKTQLCPKLGRPFFCCPSVSHGQGEERQRKEERGKSPKSKEDTKEEKVKEAGGKGEEDRGKRKMMERDREEEQDHNTMQPPHRQWGTDSQERVGTVCRPEAACFTSLLFHRVTCRDGKYHLFRKVRSFP